jgi:hypothetical protein
MFTITIEVSAVGDDISPTPSFHDLTLVLECSISFGKLNPVVATSWSDVNGDGLADMICDYSGPDAETGGNHWIQLSKGDGTFKD